MHIWMGSAKLCFLMEHVFYMQWDSWSKQTYIGRTYFHGSETQTQCEWELILKWLINLQISLPSEDI